jgi:DNA-binding XRE family transcriptional regulator
VFVTGSASCGRASGDDRQEIPPGLLLSTPALSHILIESQGYMRDNLSMKLSRLKEHRARRGLTQMELAKLSDVGRATIAAIERGKRKRVHPSTAAKLAKVLKVKPEELI